MEDTEYNLTLTIREMSSDQLTDIAGILINTMHRYAASDGKYGIEITKV